MIDSNLSTLPQDDPGSQPGIRPSPRPIQDFTQYQYSADEIRVFKECSRDSFFQRSVPIGGALGLGTAWAVQNGFLSASPRWGPAPKVLVAATVGYFLGKFSYSSKCAEKLMALPNSRLGEMLRARKRGGYRESLSMEPGGGTSLALPSFGRPVEQYTDVNPHTSYNLDTERPDQKGLDDISKPGIDASIVEEELLPPVQHETTFDELRRKNRDDFYKSRTQNYRTVLGGDDVPTVVRAPESIPPSPPIRRNKYGDPLE